MIPSLNKGGYPEDVWQDQSGGPGRHVRPPGRGERRHASAPGDGALPRGGERAEVERRLRRLQCLPPTKRVEGRASRQLVLLSQGPDSIGI